VPEGERSPVASGGRSAGTGRPRLPDGGPAGPRHRAVTARQARALGRAGPQHTWARLFLTMPEAAVLAVPLVCDDWQIRHLMG